MDNHLPSCSGCLEVQCKGCDGWTGSCLAGVVPLDDLCDECSLEVTKWRKWARESQDDGSEVNLIAEQFEIHLLADLDNEVNYTGYRPAVVTKRIELAPVPKRDVPSFEDVIAKLKATPRRAPPRP